MPILVITNSLLLVAYPLVFFNLRWKRAAKQAVQSPGTIHCARCGYERGELAVCPECGTPRTAPTARLTIAKRRVLIAGYAAIPLLLTAPFWLSWIEIGWYHLTH
jgi:hypothetical protein